MKTPPSLEILDGTYLQGPGRDMALHARVRRVLKAAIDDHFDDGQQFWTENALIERLGVSQVTVRRALLDLASEGLLERRVAKGSVVRKPEPSTFDIGCFVPQYNSDFMNEMLETLARTCRDQNRRFNVYHTFQGEKPEELWRQVEKIPRQERLLLMANPRETSQALESALRDRGHVTVIIEKPWESSAGLSVGVDNGQLVRLGVEHLRSLGHRQIVLLANEPREHLSAVQRETAFLDAARELDLPGARVFDCGTHFGEDGHDTAWRVMPQVWESRPTAIMAVSDSGAAAALQWLAEHHIAVPGRVSVLGFNNERLSRFTHPPLSSLALPFDALVRTAVELLIEASTTPRHIRLGADIVLRRSTGPVATAGYQLGRIAEPALATSQ